MSRSGADNFVRSAAQLNLKRAAKAKDWLFYYLTSLYSSTRFEKSPYRNALIRAHYSWTPQLFLLMFIFAVSTWYGETPIRCIEFYERNRAPTRVEEICIQFPYSTYHTEPVKIAKKFYATYYLYVHWLCLFLYVVYQAVFFAVIFIENKKFRNFLRDLDITHDYMHRLEMTVRYYQRYYGNHIGISFRSLCLTIFCLLVNVMSFFGIDVLLQRKYANIPRFLGITRDCSHFDDEFSMLFPPFAYCDIHPDLHIQVGRTQLYGCQLPLNEVYGKFFIALWFWQVFLAVWSVFYIFYWINVCTSRYSGLDFLDDGSYRKYPSVKKSAMKISKDEALALSIIKQSLYSPHYRLLIKAIADWDPGKKPLMLEPIRDNPIFPEVLGNLKLLPKEKGLDYVEGLLKGSKRKSKSTPNISDIKMFSSRRKSSSGDTSPVLDELNIEDGLGPRTGWRVPINKIVRFAMRKPFSSTPKKSKTKDEEHRTPLFNYGTPFAPPLSSTTLNLPSSSNTVHYDTANSTIGWNMGSSDDYFELDSDK